MARREFPALGFDPAPGDPDAVSQTARSVGAAGRTFADAAANVSRLNSSAWTGDAADAFRQQLTDLPRDLDLAARSHGGAARALSEYGSGLIARQRRAEGLERRAEELRRQQAAAIAEVNRVAAQRAPEGSAELAAMRSSYTAARSRADGYGADLAAVIRTAQHLHGEHRAAAGSAARAIRAVAEAPYEEPGWLSRSWSSVKDWISDHADVLATISGVLKGVSAVLGVLSLVPGLQVLAPFALLAAGAALLIDMGVKVVTGKGSWTAVGVDAALTFIPGGKVLSGLKGARAAVAGERGVVGAERGLAATDDAARLAGSGTPPVRSGGGGGGGGGPRIHSRYSDGTPVYEGQQPGKITGPDPAAGGPHSVLRWDEVNGRIYKVREYDADGWKVRDVDFTRPTYPNGTPRPDHHLPEQHRYVDNDPRIGPRSGQRRGPGEPLDHP